MLPAEPGETLPSGYDAVAVGVADQVDPARGPGRDQRVRRDARGAQVIGARVVVVGAVVVVVFYRYTSVAAERTVLAARDETTTAAFNPRSRHEVIALPPSYEGYRTPHGCARSGGRLLDQPDEHAGDVVRAAVLVRLLDELRPGDLDLRVLGEDPRHLLVGHRAGEAVRADEEDVAEPRLLEAGVDLDRLLHPERPHDHVLVREALDLLRGEAAHLDVLVE